MSVVSNTNTRQNPMVTPGLTGNQVVKFIQAPRVYVKAVDTTPTPVIVKSNGVTPTGWTDLGVVNGVAKVTYTKSVKDARTGLEQVLRGQYIDKKTGNVEADLAQFDDVLFSALTGITASVITAGSLVQYGMGQEGIITKACLLVCQDVLSGKEIQFYNPQVNLNLAYNTSGDEMSLKLTAEYLFFTFGGVDIMYVKSVFA